MRMITCSICCTEVLESTGSQPRISCDMCSKDFHGKCANMNRTLCTYVNANANCLWYCEQCIVMAKKLNNIASELESLRAILSDHSKIMSEQRVLISELKNKLDAREKVNESTPFLSTKSVANASSKRKYCDVVGSWAMDTQTPLTHTSEFQTVSKRAKFKKLPLFRDKNKFEPIIVIKPKVNEDGDICDVISEVKKCVNPRDDPVKNVRRTAKGNVILECKDHESVDRMRVKIGLVLNDKCSVDLPKESVPEVKLVGLQEELSESEIEAQLRAQNSEIFCDDSSLVVKQIKFIETLKSSYYTVYVQTDNDTLQKIIDRGSLKIMWSSVRCYQVLPDNRCFKCHSFDHIAAKCSLLEEQFICPKCAGWHKGKDCDSDFLKCKNCVENNVKFGTKVPTDHAVWSYQCPVLKRRHDRVRDRIRYKQ